MKKTLAIILALVLALALTGCNADELEEKINSAVDNIEAGVDSLEDKLNGEESEPEEAPTEEPEQTTEEAPAEEPDQAPAEDGVRPEIREAIDSYEAFFNEYADFMASYDATDLGAMTEYLSMMEQYTDTMQKLEDMEDADLTDAEVQYYAQAMLRIDQRLLEVSGEMAG